MSEFDQEKYPDADVVLRQAQGKWDVLIAALCPELRPLIDGNKKAMPCPSNGHHNNGDGFRLWKKKFHEEGATICNTCGVRSNGIATLMFVNGWSYPEALKAVYDELNGGGRKIEVRRRELNIPEPKPVDKSRQDAFAVKSINDIWSGTVGLGHELAEPARKYFIKRGLVPCRGPLQDMRFHPALDYFDKVEKPDRSSKTVLIGKFPAIVSAIRQPDGFPAALHRIYLTENGDKAPVQKVKKMTQIPSFRSVTGAAVRLDDAGPVLHTCEGLETGLAVRVIMEQPVWAGINTTILSNLCPPPEVELVFIWEDWDKGGAGAMAGLACQEHLRSRGVRAIRVMPEFAFQEGDEKVDWNDALLRFGRDALRRHEVCSRVRDIARDILRKHRGKVARVS
ncbi:MAG TPA: toprim domain-containing protein [Rhodanobacteraceae bacterium]|nr:toprim domain-containing protein [Rhodanobacteraceae bacterium]